MSIWSWLHSTRTADVDRAAAESDKVVEIVAEAGKPDEEEADERPDADEEVIDTGPDPEEVARRMAASAAPEHVLARSPSRRRRTPRTQKARKRLADSLGLKLSPRMFDALTARSCVAISARSARSRGDHDHRNPRRGASPRKDFIGTFPEERDQRPLDCPPQSRRARILRAAPRLKDEIERPPEEAPGSRGRLSLTISAIKDINREVSIGEAKARRAKKEMVEAEPAPGISIARNTPTAACSSSI